MRLLCDKCGRKAIPPQRLRGQGELMCRRHFFTWFRIIQKYSRKNTDIGDILFFGMFVCPKIGFHNSEDCCNLFLCTL